MHGVAKLAKELRQHDVIAVDLEHHSTFSFAGVTCLVQISTRHADYVIDGLVGLDLSPLQPVFAHAGTVKVLHGYDRVRDFGCQCCVATDPWRWL